MELMMRKVLMDNLHLQFVIIKGKNSPKRPKKRLVMTMRSQKLRW